MSIPLQPFPALPSADDLRALETDLGFDLPNDYRDFLLRYNGGGLPEEDPDSNDYVELGFYAQPVPPLADDLGWLAGDGFWGVSLFHGLLRAETQYGDLRSIHDVMHHDWSHPAELLPVASMPNNGKYFLCLSGAQRGHVLIASDTYLEKHAEGQPLTPADYHRLASSFGEMLSGLLLRRTPL